MIEGNTIQKYIEEKKEFQKLLLQNIEESDSNANDTDFQNLINYLDTHQYGGSKQEICLLIIINNQIFLKKMKRFLQFRPNNELFEIFRQK